MPSQNALYISSEINWTELRSTQYYAKCLKSKHNNSQIKMAFSLKRLALLLMLGLLTFSRNFLIVTFLLFNLQIEIYAVRSEIENNNGDLLDAEGKKFKRLTDFTPPEEPKGCQC